MAYDIDKIMITGTALQGLEEIHMTIENEVTTAGAVMFDLLRQIHDLNAKLTAQQGEIERLRNEEEHSVQALEAAAAAATRRNRDFSQTAVSIAKHLAEMSITPYRNRDALILSVVGRLLAMSAVFENTVDHDYIPF